jgi:hypothetical protein
MLVTGLVIYRRNCGERAGQKNANGAGVAGVDAPTTAVLETSAT